MMHATVLPIPDGAEVAATAFFLLVTVAFPVYLLVFRRVQAGDSWGLAEMVSVVVLFVGLLMLAAPAMGHVDLEHLAGFSAFTIAQNAFFAGLPAFVALVRYRLSPAALGLRTRGWGRGALVGAAAAIVATPLTIAGERLAIYLMGLVEGPAQAAARAAAEHIDDPLLPVLGTVDTPQSIAWVIVLLCVVVPIGEEVFFRGFLYGGLRARWGVAAATIASAFLFAFAHLQVVHGVPIFLLGILLALAYERMGSLVPAMLAHALNNAVALLSIWRGWGI